MDIYLIRHTQIAAAPGLCYGQSDVPLAESFVTERQAIAAKLPTLGSSGLVFSSPLSRCLLLAETFSTNVNTDARLMELDFGDWENNRFDDLEEAAIKHWTDHFVNIAPPNGESFADLVRRASSFWQDLVDSEAGQVFIFTHAGFIRALLVHILNLPPANAFQFKVDAGSVHKFQVHNHYTTLHYFNH